MAAQRLLRRIGLWVGGTLLGLVLLVVVALLLLQTAPARAWLAATLSQVASDAMGQRVTIGAIEGTVPTDMTVASLEIADADGVWLAARNLALDWRPASLLQGRFDIERLAAEQVHLLRAPPAAAEPEPPEPEPLRVELPSLPLEVVLRDLSVPELRLGAPVLGQEIAAALFGSANLGTEPSDARLAVDATRLDSPGRAALRLGQAPDGALSLSAEVEEPEGGILARLLELPDLPAVSLRLAGSGPTTRWQGRLDAAAGDASAGLDLTLGLGRSVELAVAGSVDPGGLPGEAVRDLVPAPIEIDAELAWTPGEAVEIGHADLSAPGLRAGLRGQLDLEAQTVDATVDLAADDPRLIAALADPVAARSVRLSARLGGQLAAPSAEIEASATGVAAPEVSADVVALTGRIAPAEDDPRRLAVTARLEPTGLALASAGAAGELAGSAPVARLDGVLDPASGDLEIASLAVTGAGFEATGRGRVAESGRDVDLSVALRLADIAPLAGMAGMPASGALVAELRLFGDATVPILAVDLDAMGEGLATENALLAALIGPSPHLVAAATIDGDAVMLEAATLTASAAELQASGSVGETLDLRISGSAPELATLAPPLGIDLAGAIAFAGDVTGPAADPAIVARIDGTNLAVTGVELGDPMLEATIGGIAAQPAGRVTVAAEPAGAALTAATGFRLTDTGGVALDALQIDGPGTRVTGDVAIGADGLLSGTLDGNIAELDAWQAVLGTALAGTAELQLELRPDGNRQHVAATLTGSDLELAETAALRALRLELEVADALGRPVLDADLSADGVAAGGIAFDRLAATAAGPLADLGWTISGSGDADPATRLDAAGRLALDQGGEVTIASLDAMVGPVEAALARPARVAWGNDGVAVEDLEAVIGDGRLSATARMAPGTLGLDATLADVPLRPLVLLATGTELGGRISGTAHLEGDPARPTGEVRLSLANLREGGTDPAETVSLAGEIAARFADGRADATASLGGHEGVALDARLSAPMGGDGPLDGQVTGAIELSVIPQVIDLRGDALDGRLDIDLALGGSLADPDARGTARLSNGAYESAEAGTVLRDLTAELVGDRDQVRLVSLSAGDGEGGTVSASGRAELDAAAGFPLRVEAEFNRFAALRRRDATVQASGGIEVTRDASGGRIAGTVTVDMAELRIPDRLGQGIVTLEVTEVNLPPGREPPPEPPEEETAPLALDVAVKVPGRAFLRGRGLDSEWRGSLQVGGTTAAPDVTGELVMVRGTLDLVGRNFRFDEGLVRFVGGGEVDPELAINATSEAEALTVHAEVSGSASAPSFTLSSEPSLPQDEILARLLFGTSTGSLTPLQAVQLAQTAATLSGRGGGMSVVDRLRDSVGLDVLGVETGESLSGSSLAIGKYLTDDVFVKMNQGVTPESRRVGVEVRVLPRVTVESDIGAQSQGNVGVNWKLDY